MTKTPKERAKKAHKSAVIVALPLSMNRRFLPSVADSMSWRSSEDEAEAVLAERLEVECRRLAAAGVAMPEIIKHTTDFATAAWRLARAHSHKRWRST